jgi:hypothetical protein
MGNQHTFSLEEIISVHQALSLLTGKPLKPVKLAYRLGRLQGRTERIVKLFHEKRQEAFNELAQENEEGRKVVKPADEAAFQQTMRELLATEESITVPDFTEADFEEADFGEQGIDAGFFSLFAPVLDRMEAPEPPKKTRRKK